MRELMQKGATERMNPNPESVCMIEPGV